MRLTRQRTNTEHSRVWDAKTKMIVERPKSGGVKPTRQRILNMRLKHLFTNTLRIVHVTLPSTPILQHGSTVGPEDF